MISKELHEKIRMFVAVLQRYTHRLWYPPLIGLLAAIDNFAIVVPTDGILISSSMLTPKRWLVLALSVAIGSTLGAIVLAALVELQGLPWILEYYPAINQTKTWSVTQQFFENYGLILVFAVAISPVMQQPAVILAGLANTPLTKLALVIFMGRVIKYLIMAYIGSHAPRLLDKMWGLKGELKDAGVKLKL